MVLVLVLVVLVLVMSLTSLMLMFTQRCWCPKVFGDQETQRTLPPDFREQWAAITETLQEVRPTQLCHLVLLLLVAVLLLVVVLLLLLLWWWR